MIRDAKESHRTIPPTSNDADAAAVDTGRDPVDLDPRTGITSRVDTARPSRGTAPKRVVPQPPLPPSVGKTRRFGKWGIAAVAAGIAILTIVAVSRATSDDSTGTQAAYEQHASDAAYEGAWLIQYQNGNRLRLTFTLFPNGIALKNGQGRGTWNTVDGSAQIVWRDGWRDRIRPSDSNSNQFENDAFRPGKTFTDRPDNTATATRQEAG